MPKPIHELVQEIRKDWKKPYFGALPYIAAMEDLDTIHSVYGCDKVSDIIMYFLCNANTWKGPVARAVKAELREYLEQGDK